jgi:6-phosphogluconolactonase
MFFFIGSYTETGSPAPFPTGLGITSCSFDPQNGTIQIIGNQFSRNPSYPIVNGSILYAAEEIAASEKPLLAAYRILEDGSLRKLNEIPINGDYACHLAIANKTILVANYGSGDILVYSIEADGRAGPLIQQIRHAGTGVNNDRQEAPHPHMMYPVDDHTVYCIDLGIDQAKAYRAEDALGKWEPVPELDIKVKAGAGARHIDMDLNKEWMVLIGELSGELFLFFQMKGQFQLMDTASLGEKEISAAAIRMHANGRFIYCSERKTNCIYAFTISNNKLQFIGKFPSGGRTPRDISIDPTGKWLLAANQDDNRISVFSIDALTGELQLVHSYTIFTPSCICWQMQNIPHEYQ